MGLLYDGPSWQPNQVDDEELLRDENGYAVGLLQQSASRQPIGLLQSQALESAYTPFTADEVKQRENPAPKEDDKNLFEKAMASTGRFLTGTKEKTKNFLQEAKDDYKETGAVGVAKSLGKGVLGAIASTPSWVGSLIEEAGENNLYGKQLSAMSQVGNPFGMLGVSIGPKQPQQKIIEAMSAKWFEKPNEFLDDFGERMRKSNEEWLKRTELAPEKAENSLAYNFGSGITSLAEAVGLTLVTKSPLPATVVFGLQTKGQTYSEAREAGMDADDASLLSTGAGVTEGLLEKVGLDFLMRPAKKMLTKVLTSTLTEALQEGLQTAGSNTWAKLGYDEQRGILDGVGESMFVGGILGGGAGIPLHVTERNNIIKVGEENGLTKEEAKVLADTVESKRAEISTGFKSAIDYVDGVLDDEIVPTPQTTAQPMVEMDSDPVLPGIQPAGTDMVQGDVAPILQTNLTNINPDEVINQAQIEEQQALEQVQQMPQPEMTQVESEVKQPEKPVSQKTESATSKVDVEGVFREYKTPKYITDNQHDPKYFEKEYRNYENPEAYEVQDDSDHYVVKYGDEFAYRVPKEVYNSKNRSELVNLVSSPGDIDSRYYGRGPSVAKGVREAIAQLETQNKADEDWDESGAGEKFAEADRKLVETNEKMKTAKASEKLDLQEEADRLNKEMTEIEDGFIQKQAGSKFKSVDDILQHYKDTHAKHSKVGLEYWLDSNVKDKALKAKVLAKFTPDMVRDPEAPKLTKTRKVELSVNEKILLGTINETGSNIDGLIDRYTARKDEILNSLVEYLKENSGLGVTQGSLSRDASGEVVGRNGRVSNNPQWYRDFYAKHNRKPSNKEYRELADKFLREGYQDFTDEIPKDSEYLKLEGVINATENIKAHLEQEGLTLAEATEQIDFARKANNGTGEQKAVDKFAPGVTTPAQSTQLNMFGKYQQERLEKIKELFFGKDTGPSVYRIKDVPMEIRENIVRSIEKVERRQTTYKKETGGVWGFHYNYKNLVAFANKTNDFIAGHEFAHHVWANYLTLEEKHQIKELSGQKTWPKVNEWYSDRFGEYVQEYMYNNKIGKSQHWSEKLVVIMRKVSNRIKAVFGKGSPLTEHFEAIIKDGLLYKGKENVIEPTFTRKQIAFSKKELESGYQGEDDLSTRLLESLVGKTTVSKQFISDLNRNPDIKQAEKAIITEALDEMTGDKVNVQEFAEKVKAKLLPLDTLATDRWENINLPEGMRGWVESYDERVYRSPIKNNAGGVHFYHDEADNYFAHVRAEDVDSETRRLIEVQSDLFQHNRYREIAGNVNETDRVIGRLIENVSRVGTSLSSGNKMSIKMANENSPYNLREYFENELEEMPDAFYRRDKVTELIDARIENLEERIKYYEPELELAESSLKHHLKQAGLEEVDFTGSYSEEWKDAFEAFRRRNSRWFDVEEAKARIKQAEVIKEIIHDPKFLEDEAYLEYVARMEPRVKDVEKLAPYRNTWWQRIIREEVKKASLDGRKYLLLPTGKTASYIEGYVGESAQVPEDARVGDYFDYGGTEYFIVDRYADDEVEVTEATAVTNSYPYQVARDEEIQNDLEEIKYALREGNDDDYLVNEVGHYIEYDYQKEWEADKLKFAEENDQHILDALEKYYDRDKYSDAESYAKYWSDNEGIRYIANDRDHIFVMDEGMMTESMTAGKTEQDEFDPNELSDDQRRVHDYYEKEVAKYIKNLGDVEMGYVDENGVSWNRLTIDEEMSDRPVIAFSKKRNFKQTEIEIFEDELPAIKKGGKFRNAYLSFREWIQDDWIRVRKLQEQEGVEFNEDSDISQAQTLFFGRTGTRIEIVDQEAERIIKEVAKEAKNLKVDSKALNKEVDRYLIALHTKDYNAQHGDGASGFTNEEARQILTEARNSGHFDVVERIAKDIKRINNQVLDVLVDSQVITKELYAKLRTTYQNHVPLQRILEGEDVQDFLTSRGFSVKSTGIKRAKGSTLEVNDILGNVVANLKQAVTKAEKNRVNLATLKFARLNDDLGLFEEVKPQAIGKDFNDNIILQEVKGDTILTVRENGKPVYLKITPELAPMFTGLSLEKIPASLKFVATMTRFYAGLATRFNPDFIIPNKVRDLQEMIVYVSSQGGAKTAIKTIKNDPGSILAVTEYLMGKDTEGARLYREMKMEGGTTGGLGLSTREKVDLDLNKVRKLAESNPRKAVEMLFKGIDNFNTVSEDSTRLSVYKAMREQGFSKAKSAQMAKEATLNFNKQGKASPLIKALYMFSNPSIQGSAKLLKSFKNPKVLASTMAVVLTAVALTNKHNDEEDEDWRDKVSEYDRNANLVWVLGTREDGGVNYITIPVSWGLKPIKVASDAFYDVVTGHSKGPGKIASSIFSAIVEGYNPVGGTDATSAVVPTFLDMPVDIARNKKWSGSKIRPDWLSGLPGPEQVFESTKDTATGKIAIGISTGLSSFNIQVSPQDLIYAYENIVGGTGRFVTKSVNTTTGIATGEEVRPDDMPVISRFVGTRTGEEVTRDIERKKETEFMGTLKNTDTEEERIQAILDYFADKSADEKKTLLFKLREVGINTSGLSYSDDPETEQILEAILERRKELEEEKANGDEEKSSSLTPKLPSLKLPSTKKINSTGGSSSSTSTRKTAKTVSTKSVPKISSLSRPRGSGIKLSKTKISKPKTISIKTAQSRLSRKKFTKRLA